MQHQQSSVVQLQTQLQRVAFNSSGIRAIFCTEPSKCLRSLTITVSQRPRSLMREQGKVNYSNSPDKLDFTYVFGMLAQ